MLAVFLRALLIGVMVAAPVGAMSVLCFRRTLVHGASRGLVTGAGIATADALYASVAAFGLTALSDALVAWQGWLGLAGGGFLVWLGVASFRSRSDAACPPAEDGPGGAAGLYGATVLLTLSNPMTILAFAAVFASAGLAVDGDAALAAIATLGVGSGSAAWWLTLVGVATLVRGRSGDGVLRGLGLVSAVVLVAFGVVAAVSGARTLLGA